MMQKTEPLFASVWQLLDSVVLVAVQPTSQGDATAVMPTENGPCVPTWVDKDRADAMLAPGFVLRQAPMVDLIRDLGEKNGSLVEPGAPNAVFVPADQRPSLRALCVPFPDGARTAWGAAPPETEPLRIELARRAARMTPIGALWVARFQVEDARERVAVVYETREVDEETDNLIVAALHEGLATINPPYPVQIVALSDLPEPTAQWLIDNVPAAYPSD